MSLLAAVLTLSACAKPPVALPTATAQPSFDWMRAADDLVRTGCLDCLVDAFRLYEREMATAPHRERAERGMLRAAALAGLRERELGLESSGWLARARDLRARLGSTADDVAVVLDVIDVIPERGDGRAIAEVNLARRQLARTHRDAWRAALRSRANGELLFAYTWLAFNCAYENGGEAERLAVSEIPDWAETPLIRVRRASCQPADEQVFAHVLADEPRFAEAHFEWGLVLRYTDEDAALEHFERALAWRTAWPALTTTLAEIYTSREDFATAIVYFDRTLALRPQSPDALLGRGLALTYDGRPQDALATLDHLLALGRWYEGDARYWRSFNEAQLGQDDAAWADIELARPLLSNAEVPKLAGTIALRRNDPETARVRLEEARRRNRGDCETVAALGHALSGLQRWADAIGAYADATTCLKQQEDRLAQEVRALSVSLERREHNIRLLARRQLDRDQGRRLRAATTFNSAVAFFRLARLDDARQAAESVVGDADYEARARSLLQALTDASTGTPAPSRPRP